MILFAKILLATSSDQITLFLVNLCQATAESRATIQGRLSWLTQSWIRYGRRLRMLVAYRTSSWPSPWVWAQALECLLISNIHQEYFQSDALTQKHLMLWLSPTRPPLCSSVHGREWWDLLCWQQGNICFCIPKMIMPSYRNLNHLISATMSHVSTSLFLTTNLCFLSQLYDDLCNLLVNMYSFHISTSSQLVLLLSPAVEASSIGPSPCLNLPIRSSMPKTWWPPVIPAMFSSICCGYCFLWTDVCGRSRWANAQYAG